ncbi:Cholecystokinin receptor [Holothuria leucospilota]|uniref:Cholecystokinin receptor n=1 Tax=Holothuria leucospilota TaxID=206669 RepID=A0A9Q1BPR5_HOLLE|nr:Cholecystokinin receptor [Holothuria leucospilota]
MNTTSVSAASFTNFMETTHPTTSETTQSISLIFVIQCVVGCLGILGNSFVCFVFLHRSTQRNQTNLLIVHQAVIDLLSSVLFVAYTGYDSIPYRYLNIYVLDALLCYVVESRVLVFGSLAVSTFNLVLISFERYFATVHSLLYRELFNRRNLSCLIALVWLIAPILQYFIVWRTRRFSGGLCEVEWSTDSFGVILFLWEYLIPVSIMSFSYVFIIKTIFMSPFSGNKISKKTPAKDQKAKTGRDKKYILDTMDKSEENSNKNQEVDEGKASSNESSLTSHTSLATISDTISDGKKSCNPPTTKTKRTGRPNSWRVEATRALIVVYLVYLVCWTPNQLIFLYSNLTGFLNLQGVFYQISVILAICNTCVNPFIYALRHQTYKERVREMFSHLNCKWCRRE